MKTTRLFLFLLLLFAAGCGQDAPAAEPAPTAESAPIAAATAEPSPAPTATATVTAVPPTLTPIPTATATPEPTPTPTPEAIALLSAEDFGTDRNPLTGELVQDPAVLQRRPLAVKIANSPPEYTRPQAGVSQADIVYEHPSEGPITRFTAIFYSQTPPDVGPIRSARLIDVELPAMYDAGLAYSGASIGVSNKLFASDFRARIIRSYEPGYYRTGEEIPYEHTLYGDPAGFWQALEEKEQNVPPTFTATMAFTSEPPEGGAPAEAVTIDYDNWTLVEWRYDAENGRYWRWADGEPSRDKNTDTQVSAANVIIVYAIHQIDMSICEFQQGDRCLAFSTEIQIWGQGRGTIVRDGQAYDVTWKRERRSDMLTFYNAAGDAVPLQIGNSWFQIVPLHYRQPVTLTP